MQRDESSCWNAVLKRYGSVFTFYEVDRKYKDVCLYLFVYFSFVSLHFFPRVKIRKNGRWYALCRCFILGCCCCCCFQDRFYKIWCYFLFFSFFSFFFCWCRCSFFCRWMSLELFLFSCRCYLRFLFFKMDCFLGFAYYVFFF